MALWTQLRTGAPTAGEDCGPVACCNVIAGLSDGRVGPDVQTPARDPQSVASWVRFLRRVAKRTTGPFLVHGDVREALDSDEVARAFRAQNLQPPIVTYRYGIAFGELRAWLTRPDRYAIVPVVYGIARRDGCPTGSTTFGGGHYVVLTNARRKRVRKGKRYVRRWFVTVGDSLMDGRRMPNTTMRYPKGWLTTRLYRYRRAAGAFGTGPDGRPRPIGQGRAIAVLVEAG